MLRGRPARELARSRLSEIISQSRRSWSTVCDGQAFRKKKTGSHEQPREKRHCESHPSRMYNASTALCPWWSMGPRQASGSSMRSGICKGRKGASLRGNATPRRNSLSPPPLLRQATVTRDDAVAAKFLVSPDAQQPNLILRLKREGKEWKCVSFLSLIHISEPTRPY